ncbi:MAG: NADH-quinone oxidoreductase subunit M [Pseudomonadota bacterium]
MDNLLSILTFTPLLAALILAIFLRGDDEAAQRNAKWLAVTATGATFFISLILLAAFDASISGFQFEEVRAWPFGLTYRMGVDGISLVFLVTVAALAPLAVAASWQVEEGVRDYIIALLTAETLLLGAFAFTDLAFFALFFEAALVPLVLMAGVWGAKGSGEAALKALLHAVPGAVLLVIALIAMAGDAQTTDIAALLRHNLPSEAFPVLGITVEGGLQTLILLGLFWSIAVKAPIWPFHTWLPDVAAKAPPAVTLLLVAALSKLALYAILRFALPILPAGTEVLAPALMLLIFFGLVAMALSALVQDRMRRLIAYAAPATLAIPLVAALSGTDHGIDGAIMAVAAHGLTMAGLILGLLVVETRLRSDEFSLMGGVRLRLPGFALILLLFCFAAFGLPGTGSFVALFLAVLGALSFAPWAALVMAFSLVFLAAVTVSLYRRVALGEAFREQVRTMPPLLLRERLSLGLAAVALVIIGLWPALLLGKVSMSTGSLAALYEAATQP